MPRAKTQVQMSDTQQYFPPEILSCFSVGYSQRGMWWLHWFCYEQSACIRNFVQRLFKMQLRRWGNTDWPSADLGRAAMQERGSCFCFTTWGRSKIDVWQWGERKQVHPKKNISKQAVEEQENCLAWSWLGHMEKYSWTHQKTIHPSRGDTKFSDWTKCSFRSFPNAAS